MIYKYWAAAFMLALGFSGSQVRADGSVTSGRSEAGASVAKSSITPPQLATADPQPLRPAGLSTPDVPIAQKGDAPVGNRVRVDLDLDEAASDRALSPARKFASPVQPTSTLVGPDASGARLFEAGHTVVHFLQELAKVEGWTLIWEAPDFVVEKTVPISSDLLRAVSDLLSALEMSGNDMTAYIYRGNKVIHVKERSK